MKPFIADARYIRHIEASIALAIDECRRDKKYRSFGGDKGLIVDNAMIDEAETGTLVVLVGTTRKPIDEARLQAFAHPI